MRTVLNSRALAAMLLAAAVVLAGACGGGDEEAAGVEPAATAVASTPHVADIARNVAGGRAEVVGLLAANADPHDHEPRPSDAEAVAEADLVLKSGGDLDLWMEGVVESSGGDAPVVELIDAVETIAGGAHDHGPAHDDDERAHDDGHGHGHADGQDPDEAAASADEEIDPHWWQDPRNAALAAEEIRDRLTELDPSGRRAYEANAAAYLDRLERLDRAIAACIEEIPAHERKLVTSHDSFGYFASRYGLDVVGAAIPALTTQAQPSAGDTSELIELIREQNARAVFPEAGLSDRLERAIAGQTDADVGDALWADTLGPEGSGAETYIGATAENARTLAAGLSGGELACEGLPDG